MSITHVSIEGLKTHAKTELSFGAITVLVGPNGSGKSTIMQAVDFMTKLPQAHWMSLSSDRILQGARPEQSAVRISIKGEGPVARPGSGGTAQIADWELAFEASKSSGKWIPEVTWRQADIAASVREKGRRQVYQSLTEFSQDAVGTSSLLRLDPDSLAAPSRVLISNGMPTLGAQGQGLAAVLSALKLFSEDKLRTIESDLRSVVPAVTGVRLAAATWGEHVADEGGSESWETISGAQVLFDFPGVEGVQAAEVSDGTLLALGAITAARVAAPPRIVLLDDIERGLHPRAQRELIQTIRRIAGPDIQFIITSHSPYLVDALEMDEVFVLALREDGTSVGRKLSDHPDSERSKGILSTGEFLAAEEESWVAETAERA
jgi:predicted ATPase